MGFEDLLKNEEASNQALDIKALKIVSKERDPYRFYREQYADITMRSGRHYFGVYQGLNESNELVLLPCIIAQFIPNEKDEKEGRHIWQAVNFPEYLNAQDIEAVSPIDPDYVRFRIEQSQEKKRIILPWIK